MNSRLIRRWVPLLTVALLGCGVMAVSGNSQGTAPLTASRYSLLSSDGSEVASFNSLQGITTEVDVAEYVSSSGRDPTLQKASSAQKPPVLTLKRPESSSLALWSWHQAALRGDATARRSASLVMFNSDGKPVAKFFLENAFPSKIVVGATKTASGQALFETVTLVAEQLQRVSL